MDNNKNIDPPMTSGSGGNYSHYEAAAHTKSDQQEQQKIRKYVKMLWGILAAIVLGTIVMFA
ncbi:MAG: hypothetical protein PHX39_02595, partial [Bacteroidales bacterium]|nr:hypothetical protein [Bacteroidales bacterium]